MGTGQQFAKKLGAVGCVLVLAAAVISTVLMFTARGGKVDGYTPPQGSDYYAVRLEELMEELNANLLPKLEARDVTVELTDGRLLITAPEEALNTVRLTLTYYFDEELFEFQTK